MTVVRQRLRALSRSIAPRIRATRRGPHLAEISGMRISFEKGDISSIETDAIVNSAQYTMRMSAGVGEALVKRGGQSIEDEAMAAGEHALGDCIATSAGTLDARGILHAVGGWREVSCVSRATHRALLLAEELGYTRIAMPAVATGIGRVSIEACADAMISVLRFHAALGASRIREVRFVLADDSRFNRFFDVAAAILFGEEDASERHEAVEEAVHAYDSTGSAPTVFAANTGSGSVPRAPTEKLG